MLLSKEVYATLCSRTIKHYENLGYEIPRRINKYGNLTVKQGTKILVKTSDLPSGSNIKVDVKCDNCGKEYQICYYDYLKHLHDGKTFCCDCASKILLSGKNHYLWDETKTEEERIKGRRTTDGYTDFIKIVLQRDNYTCQCCNKNNCRLHVHHLNGYDWYEIGRTDPNNGISLCEDCHKKFHEVYGKGNNTKEQFEEWMGSIVKLPDSTLIFPYICKKIYCFENNTIYDSMDSFLKEFNIKNSAYAYMVCNKKSYSGISPKTVHGLHILWYDDYLQMTEEEINNYVENNKGNVRKEIICLTTNKVFRSISEGARFYKVDRKIISKCCNGKIEYHVCNNGLILEWMFYDDYIKNKEKKYER